MNEFATGFKSFDARISEERAKRILAGQNKLQFGISFLDEALGGIYANDLVLIGAKTGFGKTQLATLIALANAKLNKRVGYIALEAEEYEIERRIKYQMICKEFFALPVQDRPQIHLNYMDWYYGRLDQELSQIEEAVEASSPIFPTLQTFYRGNEFDVNEFERISYGIKDEIDLLIIDHLHYFDYDDENENRAVKRIVKKIRDVALITGKPIVLIAHIRKSDRKSKQLLPEIEDFHGTSDTPKICTKAITIAPASDQPNPGMRQTFMGVLKCRVDGTRTFNIANLAYNHMKQVYQREYFLGRQADDSGKFIPFGFNDMPRWATNAMVSDDAYV